MYSLIRFFEKEEYLNDFLNGHLYMSSLGRFWKLGQPNPQDDLLEGVIEKISADNYKKKYGNDISSPFDSHLLFPIMNRLVGYQFVHLLCFYMHEYDPILHQAVRIPKSIKGLGEYAIRIKDMQNFVNLLFDKVVSEKLYGLMGPITYRNPSGELEYLDCFDKSIVHKDEHEWRFALIPDMNAAIKAAEEQRQLNTKRNANDPQIVYDHAVYFDVGNLRNLAEVVDANLLIKNAGLTYGNYKTVERLSCVKEEQQKQLNIFRSIGLQTTYQANPFQYVGFSPREAFLGKVREIDNGLQPVLTLF